MTMMTMLIEPSTKRSMITQCTLIARHNRGKEIEEKKRSIVHLLLTPTLPNHSLNIVSSKKINRKKNKVRRKTDRSKYAKSPKAWRQGINFELCIVCHQHPKLCQGVINKIWLLKWMRYPPHHNSKTFASAVVMLSTNSHRHVCCIMHHETLPRCAISTHISQRNAPLTLNLLPHVACT